MISYHDQNIQSDCGLNKTAETNQKNDWQSKKRIKLSAICNGSHQSLARSYLLADTEYRLRAVTNTQSITVTRRGHLVSSVVA